MKAAAQHLPLAVTMGEPAGIGGEITLMAWRARNSALLPPFFIVDDPERLAAVARTARLDVPLAEIARPEDAARIFSTALPVLPIGAPVHAVLGRPDPATGRAVVASIDQAVGLVRQGRAAAVVTNPIHKHVMYQSGFTAPGHTEYLAQLAGVPRAVMMLACPRLRVVPVTVHIPLRRAVAEISADEIVTQSMICASALKIDFGISAPRIAVAGLNPHAGEDGSIGDEEIRFIAPAVARLRSQGIDAFGPLPPDTMFHDEARRRYDVAVCMYHDQALIPLKALGFWEGINISLGLPFVRTSPDHGVALDMAGTGKARPESLIAAIAAAGEFAARRSAYAADHAIA